MKQKILDLLCINGRVETQRLNEFYFARHGAQQEWDYLAQNGVVCTKTLYMFIYGETSTCAEPGCTNERRFMTFKQGFKKYCERCARSVHSTMKHQGTVNIDLGNIVDYVKDKNGKYSTTRIKSLSRATIDALRAKVPHLGKDASVAEVLYNFEHNCSALPRCAVCGKEHSKFRYKTGYIECCSHECSRKHFASTRIAAMRKKAYNDYLSKFKSNENYDIEMFSADEYLYAQERMIKFKHLQCGHEYSYDVKYQGHHKCPKCYPVRSRKQYEIYDWLSGVAQCRFNDRQIIKPMEIDIVYGNIGIEYDSLMYHSYGYSSVSWLNNTKEEKNKHKSKTILCESAGVQLLHVFSNEWKHKQEIWKSVILNKLGVLPKIYARKCQIKDVSPSDAKKFLRENHLQGGVSQSIRLGLYYNDELVSLMTFGKSRYNKSVQYELIRFCSKLNYSVVGGASKLLRHFERTYNPQSIISYANRRWSTGGLYHKLGFELTGSTPANYFYFKKEYDELQSRVKFQKHKLKNILEVFDENLSESENMYVNGYRKIYDSGNLVFIKRY
jgi:hypothetical protein